MDLTATTTELAGAASDAVRLMPGRLLDPVLSGLLLTADADGVVLAGCDRARAARLSCPAAVHTDGRVLVPAKPLAETLRALEQHTVRLVVEGTRLAIRAPGARYALPLLDVDVHPGVPAPPPLVGTVAGGSLASVLATVAATASRDDALPMFTGVRVRSDGDRLVLLATDRFRMALASLPWDPVGPPVDALVPAALLVEIARQISDTGPVSLHTDRDRIGLAWNKSVVTTAVLDGSYIHESKVDTSSVDTRVEIDADALAGAVRRVGLYTDARGVLLVEVGDGEVRLRGADRQAGEAEESVKATVSSGGQAPRPPAGGAPPPGPPVDGGRTGQAFQARFLADALRPFAGGAVRMAIQPGMRATVFSAADPGEVDLRYIVMPMLPPKQ